VDGELGEFFPVDPAAVGVVEGDVVEDDEGAAGCGGAEAAEGDAFGGGVGDEGAGAAEELEAGDLAEFAVEGGRGGLLKLLRVEDAGAGRTVGGAERGTIGGDGDGLERLTEDDVEGLTCGNRNYRGYDPSVEDTASRSPDMSVMVAEGIGSPCALRTVPWIWARANAVRDKAMAATRRSRMGEKRMRSVQGRA
jgi:hypothetical protein